MLLKDKKISQGELTADRLTLQNLDRLDDQTYYLEKPE